jgi:primase-polymerase (primpol)-like protein
MRRRDRWIRHAAKVPKTVHGRAASSTDPATWSTFDQALASHVGDGLGFVLAGDGIACIDLDHCLEGGDLADWAREVLGLAGPTYVEVSPSGTGLHIFGKGVVGKGHRRDGVECYDRGRYMTITGRRFEGAPVKLGRIQYALDAIRA